MSSIKKLLILVIATITFFTTSCSFNEDKTGLDPKKPVTVTLWHYYSSETQIAFEQLVKEFNSTVGVEKGVIINSIAKGNVSELEDELTNAAKGVVNSDEMPDLFTVYEDKLVEIDSYEKVCDLNQYFSEEDKSKYVDEFIYTNSDERLLSIPTVKGTEVFYVNKTALSKFFLETEGDYVDGNTWEYYYILSRDYYNWTDAKTPDILWDGKSFMGFDSLANYIIAGNKQLGVEIIDGDKCVVNLNLEALNKIFDLYYKGMSLGYFNKVGAFRSDDVKAGDLVAYVGSTTSVSYFPTSLNIDGKVEPIELLVKNYPVFDGGEAYSIQQGAGMSVSNTSPEKQEGATLFIKWFTEPKQNLEFAKVSSYLPVQKESVTQEYVVDEATEEKYKEKEKNIATVYNLARNQILDGYTYSPLGFESSYDVRKLLGNSLKEYGEKGKETANQLKSEGLTEDEIIEKLESDKVFKEWIEYLETILGKLEVNYTIS